jgi:hypothetical protein
LLIIIKLQRQLKELFLIVMGIIIKYMEGSSDVVGKIFLYILCQNNNKKQSLRLPAGSADGVAMARGPNSGFIDKVIAAIYSIR